MVGSAGDFLQLLETLRKGGAPLLPESLVREMITNQIGDLPMPFWPGRGLAWGSQSLKILLPQTQRSPLAHGAWAAPMAIRGSSIPSSG